MISLIVVLQLELLLPDLNQQDHPHQGRPNLLKDPLIKLLKDKLINLHKGQLIKPLKGKRQEHPHQGRPKLHGIHMRMKKTTTPKDFDQVQLLGIYIFKYRR